MSAALVTGVAIAQNDRINPLAGTEQPSKVTLTPPQVNELCIATANQSGLILDGKELCEASIDGGKTWMSLEKALLLGG